MRAGSITAMDTDTAAGSIINRKKRIKQIDAGMWIWIHVPAFFMSSFYIKPVPK